MSIKNFTTSIESDKTITEITTILRKRGAQKISIDYDAEGNPVALSFLLLWDLSPVSYMLPCNFEGIKNAMLKDRNISRGKCTTEQALRVGWRILKDWVAAQMAIVEAEACTAAQVFLPYAVMRDGKTIYQMVETSKNKLLMLPE